MEHFEIQSEHWKQEKKPPQALLNAMLEAIRVHAEAENLSDEKLIEICELSYQNSRIHDSEWLIRQLQLAKLEAPSGKRGLAEPIVSQVQSVSSQDELEKLLKEHAKWIEQTLSSSLEAASGRLHLSGADLRNFDLMGRDFRGALLKSCNFEGLNLRRCNFSTAVLTGSSFRDCDLHSAKLRRSELTHVEWSDANLKDCDLRFAKFERNAIESARSIDGAVFE